MIPAGTRLGPYEIVGAIGAGGMGHVYSARDTRLDRSVALKVLAPQLAGNSDFRLRFEREARVISGLNHPNICTLHDIGQATIESTDNGGPAPDSGETAGQASSVISYLVMELCEGQTLAERLEKGPLPIDQLLRYAIQIAAALDRAHRSGITHRDLKPANIMLTRSGAKLLDFGLAKPLLVLGRTGGPSVSDSILANGATEQKALTAEGTILGTFQYMAPEQIEGLEADARSDIFAFGAVLYEMITGRRAFEGKTKASLIASILDREPPSITELQPLAPPPLTRIVSSCLAKDPDERWQSAHDLMRELEWVREGISATTAVEPVARKKKLRRSLPWLLAALSTIAAIAAWLQPAPAVPQRHLVSAVAPPSGAHFSVTGDAAGPVTLSPDGRWATYVAFGESGPQLWLQSLESGDVSQLRGTDKAMFPFWSPDSRSIGFFAAGRLLVIDIDGSAPRVLADAPDSRGGAWGSGGEILFSPTTQAGLHRVSAFGGNSTPVTTVRSPHTTHRWPYFLDDGKHFVYLAASHGDPIGSATAVYFASLDGSIDRKLLDTATSAIVHAGHLLYVRSNRLLAQRLSAGVLDGEPVRIRENVLHDPGTWRSIFSVSNTGLLAYHPTGATLGSHLVWVDRHGMQLGQMPPGPISDVQLSPDGQKLAIVIGDPKGTLFIHELARSVETRLSFVDGAIDSPVWSRDGRYVVFQAVTPHGYQMFIKRSDGSQPERKIHEDSDMIRPTDVSPDGSIVLFDGFHEGRGAVMALPLSGGKPYPVIAVNGVAYGGRLSPDGRWMTYTVIDGGGRSTFVAPFPGPGGRWQVSNQTAFWSWWSPNGREIFYLAGDEIVAVEVTVQGDSLRLGAPNPLFPVSVNSNWNSVTGDGERFLVVTDQPRGSGAAILVTNWDAALK
jgi:eukaryotic-like serine/threonine-protein kinase